MRKKIMGILFMLAIFCFFSPLSFPQDSLKGGIAGIVLDENGEPLPGATLALTGEKLFQYSASFVTSNKGLFRFLELIPGEYQLEISLGGFNTQKVTGISVRVGQSTPIRVIMTITKQKEEIIVTGKAPFIDTQSTQISTNFNNATIESIPSANRKFIDIIDATPAVNDYGGAYGGGAERGGQSISNSYRLNGVDVSNADIGNTWVEPNYDTIEEIEVTGIGAPAEYGNFTGVNINVVTKSGSNHFHGGISSYFTNNSFYGDNSGGIRDLKPTDIKHNFETVGSIGGPIIKEKLFFFAAGGYTSIEERSYGAPAYGLLKHPTGQLKLDWLLTPRNSLSLMVNMDPRKEENLGLRANSGPEIALTRLYDTTTIYGAWRSILSNNTILSLKYAGYRANYEYIPVVSDKPYYYDYWTGIRFQSAGRMADQNRYRDEIDAVLTQFVDDFIGASHEFKFGLEYERSRANNIDALTGPGGSGFYGIPISGNTRISATVGYDVHYDMSIKRFGGFIQDDFRLGNKLAVNLGLRVDAPKLIWWDWDNPVTSWLMLSPRFGLSYDLAGDAKDVAHIHFGRYYDKMTVYGWQGAVPSFPEMTYYKYLYPGQFYPTAENLAQLYDMVVQPENVSFIVPGLVPNDVDPDINHGMYTDVFNIGYEKELLKEFVLSIDYIYKRDRGMITIDDRAQHTYEKRQWTDPWLGNTIDIWEQMDRTPADYYYTNSSWAKRRHHFFIVALQKSHMGRWSMNASYTYQNSMGNVENDDGVALGLWPWGRDNDPYYTENSAYQWGPLTWERPHQFKLFGTFLLPWGISISGDFRAISGRAWNASVDLNDAQAFYREGSHELLLEKRGSHRYPMVVNMNLRLSKDFSVGRFSNLQLSADVINLFNKDDGRFYALAPYAVYPISQESSFGKPTSLYAPLHLRLGVRWTF